MNYKNIIDLFRFRDVTFEFVEPLYPVDVFHHFHFKRSKSGLLGQQ